MIQSINIQVFQLLESLVGRDEERGVQVVGVKDFACHSHR